MILVSHYCCEACFNAALSIGAEFYEWSFSSCEKGDYMRLKLKDKGIIA